MYSRNTKTTNASNTNTNRQTTDEHLGHLKDLEIFKYKRFYSPQRPLKYLNINENRKHECR